MKSEWAPSCLAISRAPCCQAGRGRETEVTASNVHPLVPVEVETMNVPVPYPPSSSPASVAEEPSPQGWEPCALTWYAILNPVWLITWNTAWGLRTSSGASGNGNALLKHRNETVNTRGGTDG